MSAEDQSPRVTRSTLEYPDGLQGVTHYDACCDGPEGFPSDTRDMHAKNRTPLPPQYRCRLQPSFLKQFQTQVHDTVFGALTSFVIYDKYSRMLPSGRKETWPEICKRVVETTMRDICRHLHQQGLAPLPDLQERAQRAYRQMHDRRVIPAGRIVWGSGAQGQMLDVADTLHNCAFVSTGHTLAKLMQAMYFIVMRSMFGNGVGMDLDAATDERSDIFVEGFYGQQSGEHRPVRCIIPDTREGWADSIAQLLYNGITGAPDLQFDYSFVRPKGMVIKGMGGISSGPEALEKLHRQLRTFLAANGQAKLGLTTLANWINAVGACVCSGNLRRNAMIMLGPNTPEFLDLKNYELHPERQEIGWSSNNSVRVTCVEQDLSQALERTQRFSEPGFIFMHNIHRFGRMNGEVDERDRLVAGINPCGEQPLEDGEVCCLVEIMSDRFDSEEEFLEAMEAAIFFGKTAMLGESLWRISNETIQRNRRIGVGLAGVWNFIAKRGIDELKRWCKDGYGRLRQQDAELSSALQINCSTRLTTVKPGGTIPLVGGSLSGISPAPGRYLLRTARIPSTHPLVSEFQRCGFRVEPDVQAPDVRSVVYFPVEFHEKVPTCDSTSLWDQVHLCHLMQKYWSDNSVSCTVTFKPDEVEQLPQVVAFAKQHLKALTLMPLNTTYYPQLPNQSVTREEYEQCRDNIREWPDFDRLCRVLDGQQDASPLPGCDSDRCQTPLRVE
jgi:adenosylcobalamin-dependent ribonucleoside-triphosphate reductase